MAITSEELTEWIKRIHALKQVMILTFGTRWRTELAQFADKLQ